MSKICVEIAVSYHGHIYAQCEVIDLDEVHGPEQYAEALAAQTRVMYEEAARRYSVQEWREIECKAEIIDLDDIPERYLLPTNNNFSSEFWRINLTRHYDRTKQSVKIPEAAYYAADELGIPPEQVNQVYQGYWQSDEEFAYDMADSMGMDTTAWPLSTIDWEQAARELMQDYRQRDGYYFRH